MNIRQKTFSIFTLTTLFFYAAFSNVAYAANNPEVAIETSKGSFTVELFPDKAPITVENFLRYVDEGFYNGTIFHRIVKDYVAQGGGFAPGMKPKKTHKNIKNESDNMLKNNKGSISMARRMHPDSATSQFFINLSDNNNLDYKSQVQPGYTVFGKVSKGMDVIDKMAVVETRKVDRAANVPVEDIKIISTKLIKSEKAASKPGKKQTEAAEKKTGEAPFIEGTHYVVLDKPVPTRDSSKIEVVEMFSYGCPHCYEFESDVKKWGSSQKSDVDFWFFPAVWNRPMKLYAKAFYTANELKVAEKIHMPLFHALVVQNKNIRNERDLSNFFGEHGVSQERFKIVFNSLKVRELADRAEKRVKEYKPTGVPELVVNGKYRVDRMRAGGMEQMLAVADYLVEKERKKLAKK